MASRVDKRARRSCSMCKRGIYESMFHKPECTARGGGRGRREGFWDRWLRRWPEKWRAFVWCRIKSQGFREATFGSGRSAPSQWRRQKYCMRTKLIRYWSIGKKWGDMQNVISPFLASGHKLSVRTEKLAALEECIHGTSLAITLFPMKGSPCSPIV
jgi:hypothetical protein